MKMRLESFFDWLRGAVIVWIVVTHIRHVRGEIRCFCNEASCVNKSYMCKSTLNSCFVMLSTEGLTTRTTHGCADTLLPEVRVTCAVAPEVNSVVPTSGARQQLTCCADDMCNYNLEASDVHPSAARLSVPVSPTVSAMSSGPYNEYLRGEVWFKAAVIAVPIAGILILGLLVLLAVRMLRTESTSGSRCRIADLSNSQLDLSVKHFSSCSHVPDSYSHVTDSYSHVTDHVCCVHEMSCKDCSKSCSMPRQDAGSRHSNCSGRTDQLTAPNARKQHGYTKILAHQCQHVGLINNSCIDNVHRSRTQSTDRTDTSDVELV